MSWEKHYNRGPWGGLGDSEGGRRLIAANATPDQVARLTPESLPPMIKALMNDGHNLQELLAGLQELAVAATMAAVYLQDAICGIEIPSAKRMAEGAAADVADLVGYVDGPPGFH